MAVARQLSQLIPLLSGLLQRQHQPVGVLTVAIIVRQLLSGPKTQLVIEGLRLFIGIAYLQPDRPQPASLPS